MRDCGDNRVLVSIDHSGIVAQTSWPRAVISTNPGIEVTEDEQRILRWNFADGSTKGRHRTYPSILMQRLMLEHKH